MPIGAPPAPPPAASAIAEIVITAPRLPADPQERALSIATVDRAQLQAAPRLDEALEQVPGLSLFRRTSSLGANPTTQGVSLRGIAGSGASRALVTLDGVPQNDPFGGWVVWTGLPPQIIGAVRIVRGAGSGPYGAGALTGVVALQQASARSGAWNATLEAGSLGQLRTQAGAATALGSGVLELDGGIDRSEGWVPVRQGRGPADDRLWLRDGFGQLRWLAAMGSATAEIRASLFEESRGAGLVGAGSRDRGAQFSATAAQSPGEGAMGWRAQVWTTFSDLVNRSVSVAPQRVSTSLADDQYATPALGLGANFAARQLSSAWTMEEGIDVRGAGGEDRERFRPAQGRLTADRHAGGRSFVGGFYGEVTRIGGPLTLAAAARLDGWADFDAHRIERSLLTGATTLDLRPSDRGGLVPSGRLAARLDLGGGGFLRAAAYSGFRPPTLNELYRPFRLGNNVTEANAQLVPERLWGIEAGAGVTRAAFSADATVFYNQLDDAVANVTLRAGPFLDPVEGYIPVGGVLIQRRNIASIAATGVEADVRWRLGPDLSATAAFDWTDATMHGGAQAAALTGLRPAETPQWTATGALIWQPLARLSMRGELRYESARFADDRNTLRLAAASVIDAEADWRASRRALFYVAADNLFDAAEATDETADRIVSYGAPRVIRLGVRLSGGPA